MNRYIVIRRSDISDLEAAVNGYIDQRGYEPIGGVKGIATNEERTEILWFQTLLRPAQVTVSHGIQTAPVEPSEREVRER